MAVILTKKKDTTGAPAAGDLTNSAGGAELAVNTADKRLYTKDSGGNVVEVGTNPGAAVTFTAGTAAAPAITTSGDTNTGIFFPAADTIAFAEGGAEAMRIDSSGNVGIGTTSPGFKFDIVGAINLQGSSTFPTTGVFHRSADNQLKIIGGSAGISFAEQSGASTFATIDSSGNVGIGTSSPVPNNAGAKTLQIGGGSFGVDIRLTNTATGGTASNGSAIVLDAANFYLWNYENAFTAFGTNNTERMRIDSSGNVGIGATPSAVGAYRVLELNATTGGLMYYQANGTRVMQLYGTATEAGLINMANAPLLFGSNNLERARITSGGDFYIGTTVNVLSGNTVGTNIFAGGQANLSANGSASLFINRKTDDGTLVAFYQDATQEGTITVTGNTVSYNSFAGAHWSQLQQGRGYNPDIPRGTVMSSIGEMAEWKSVVWDEVIEHPAIPAVEAVEGKEAVLDEEGNVIEPAVEAVAAVEGKDAWTETIPHREAYLGNLPVGATFTEDGVTKTVVDDGNERLPKVKISDVVGDKAVYGVFQTYDEVQDMLVTALGAFVVRIAAGVTVQIGDLLESNGDGCAKVQDDDVIRSKTIGKVTSTVKTATYADGSYTVPCVLYCG